MTTEDLEKDLEIAALTVVGHHKFDDAIPEEIRGKYLATKMAKVLESRGAVIAQVDGVLSVCQQEDPALLLLEMGQPISIASIADQAMGIQAAVTSPLYVKDNRPSAFVKALNSSQADAGIEVRAYPGKPSKLNAFQKAIQSSWADQERNNV